MEICSIKSPNRWYWSGWRGIIFPVRGGYGRQRLSTTPSGATDARSTPYAPKATETPYGRTPLYVGQRRTPIQATSLRAKGAQAAATWAKAYSQGPRESNQASRRESIYRDRLPIDALAERTPRQRLLAIRIVSCEWRGCRERKVGTVNCLCIFDRSHRKRQP